jgi:hypothetical protein
MKTKSLLPAMALVLSMLALAQFADRKEIIFPEIAALAFGAWVMDRMPWRGRRLCLWFSPTLAAVTGVVLQRWLPDQPLAAILLAFAVVAAELRLCRSGILPSVSAAILPIITRTTSWWYPVSVCLLAAAIALGRAWLAAPAGPADPEGGEARPDQGETGESLGLVHWLKLLGVIALVSVLALTSGWLFIIAPPLFVLLIELSVRENPARDHPLKVIFLVSLSAGLGTAFLALLSGVPYCPVLVPAGLALLGVIYLQYRTGLYSPPAIAIALLPTIVPSAYAPWYPLHVALGCACVVGASLLVFPGKPVLARR